MQGEIYHPINEGRTPELDRGMEGGEDVCSLFERQRRKNKEQSRGESVPRGLN